MRGVEIFKNRDFTGKTKVLGVGSVTIRFPVKSDADSYQNHPKTWLGWKVMAKSVFWPYVRGQKRGQKQMRNCHMIFR